jgi:hypothetical protein
MQLRRLSSVATSVILVALPVFAGEWLDEFDKEDLDEAWFRITDRPEGQGSVTIEDGKLLINDPNGNFGHLITDGRPLVLRKAPEGDFSISTLIDTFPPAIPKDYWIGLFVVGGDGDHGVLADNWAVLNIGGSAGEVKALIGSMIDSAWNDKGHFDIPNWPVYLKLDKVGIQYTGYYREKPTDEWIKVGESWTHDGMEEPELVGLGFINSWGGVNLTLMAEYFLLEGENVVPMAVQSVHKLSGTWGYIKEGEN